MDEENITPERVLDAASSLFNDIEDKDMRSAISQLAAMLLLPDLDWPLDADSPAVKITEAAIVNTLHNWTASL